MGVPSAVIREIYQRLDRIKTLSKEVEDIPNFGPDLWTRREGDKKCQQIQQDAQCIRKQLSNYVGTGHS
jgi:hypothetical protein